MARSAGRTRPVIKDVAKLAGVSAPTVSRYLNGTVNVTEDKRERIAKAIKELGYEPSIVARALSNREMDSVVVFAANPPPSPRPKRTMGWRPPPVNVGSCSILFLWTSPTWTPSRLACAWVCRSGRRA